MTTQQGFELFVMSLLIVGIIAMLIAIRRGSV